MLFGLAGLPAAGELHGDMTQAARLESLERFRKGEVAFLLATDVAARGLDILGVEAVVNFDCPTQVGAAFLSAGWWCCPVPARFYTRAAFLPNPDQVTLLLPCLAPALQLSSYLHRVGRTARAGNKGRALTFIEDDDRQLLKEVSVSI